METRLVNTAVSTGPYWPQLTLRGLVRYDSVHSGTHVEK
jgi:hypothetical protein